MEVKKENVLAAYETARETGADSTMKVLESLFGEETFNPKDVKERIKTFDDARNELGDEHPLVREWEHWADAYSTDLKAYLQLRIVAAALNEGWHPRFTATEKIYLPCFYLLTSGQIERQDIIWKRDRHLISTDGFDTGYTGFAFAFSYSVDPSSFSHGYFGSLLCLKSRELSDYCGAQFIDMWAEFNFMRR